MRNRSRRKNKGKRSKRFVPLVKLKYEEEKEKQLK